MWPDKMYLRVRKINQFLTKQKCLLFSLCLQKISKIKISSPSIRLQDTLIINISESNQSVSQFFYRETVSKKSNSLRLLLLVGLGQASAAKRKLASGVFDHLSSDWQIDWFMWKQESFFSLFDTKELRLEIKMLLFNWMADFFDHQYLLEYLIDLLDFVNIVT